MTGLHFLSVSSASALGAANTPRGMTCRTFRGAVSDWDVSAMLALRKDPHRRRPATPRLPRNLGGSFGQRTPLPYVATKRFDEPWCPQSRPETPFGLSRPQTPFVSLRPEEDDEGSGSPETARKLLSAMAKPALTRAPTAPHLRQRLLEAASDRPATASSALPSLQRSQSVFDVARAALALAAPEGVHYSTSLELATRSHSSKLGLRAAARLIPPKALPAVAAVIAAAVPAVVPDGGADKKLKRSSSELLSALSSQASSKRLVGGVAAFAASSASGGWEAREP